MLKRLRARLSPPPYGRLPRLVVNGFPKGGTHLLVRCVVVLGGEQRLDFVYLRGELRRRLGAAVPRGGDGIPLGIGYPNWFAAGEVERVLAGLWQGEFAAGHIPYSDAFRQLLERLGLRMLTILRDPRDVVVSHLHYILHRPESRRYKYFTETLRTPEERLLAAITGVAEGQDAGGTRLRGIGERLAAVVPWLSVPFNYTTRFERLVGPQGGGSGEAQRAEIVHIARHLGLSLAPEQIESVAGRLFGQGSVTFRRGQIGSWREHFKEEHKAALKGVAGQELIALGYERDLNW